MHTHKKDMKIIKKGIKDESWVIPVWKITSPWLYDSNGIENTAT